MPKCKWMTVLDTAILRTENKVLNSATLQRSSMKTKFIHFTNSALQWQPSFPYIIFNTHYMIQFLFRGDRRATAAIPWIQKADALFGIICVRAGWILVWVFSSLLLLFVIRFLFTHLFIQFSTNCFRLYAFILYIPFFFSNTVQLSFHKNAETLHLIKYWERETHTEEIVGKKVRQ